MLIIITITIIIVLPRLLIIGNFLKASITVLLIISDLLYEYSVSIKLTLKRFYLHNSTLKFYTKY